MTYAPGCQIESLQLYGMEYYPVRPRYFTNLKGYYYPGAFLAGPVSFTRADFDINFSWYTYGPTAWYAPAIVGRPFNSTLYSAVWNATLTPPVTAQGGVIAIQADGDPFRLFLNGQMVLDTWGTNGKGPNTVAADLVQGQPIQFELWYDVPRVLHDGLRVSWQVQPSGRPEFIGPVELAAPGRREYGHCSSCTRSSISHSGCCVLRHVLI